MNGIIGVCFLLLAGYTGVLLWLALGFLRTKTFVAREKHLQIPLTLIICARNEEKTIGRCLNSILAQNYLPSRIQVILINDASSDGTVQRAETVLKTSGVTYRIISNTQQKGKKESISYAMQFATNEVVVLRDADTFTRSSNYLQSISDFYQASHPDFIIAPLAIADNSGLFWALQAIENNVLALAACGSAYYQRPFLCNGANLIFTRRIFEKTNGFASHIHLASGDDIFFMEDVKKIPGAKIEYLKSKEAIVYTYPVFSLRALILQRTRWASKFKTNKNTLNRLLAFLSFAVNSGWLFCFVGSSFPAYRSTCLLFILLKLFIDILLLFLASNFIKNKHILWFSLPVSFIYPVYAGMVALSALLIKPRWK